MESGEGKGGSGSGAGGSKRGRVSTEFDRMAAPPGEGRKVVLPLPGGGSKGGRGREGQDIGPYRAPESVVLQ